MKRLTIKVSGGQQGKRLDVAVSERLPELSRRKVRAIIDVGGVYVNRRRIRIASREVFAGDVIEVEYDEAALTQKKREDRFVFRDEDILYRNHDIIVVNKPPGLPTQATRAQAVSHVIPALESYLKQLGEKPPRLTLVHRLDMETSGALIVAENAKVAEWLSEEFKTRHVKKVYHAACYGIPREPAFTVSCQLSAIIPGICIVKVRQRGGKDSLTHFELMRMNKTRQLSLIAAQPVTGRTHQIRVHLEHKGYPIVGDKKYGRARVKLGEDVAELTTHHQFLHAFSITFKPAAEIAEVTVEAPYPEAMRKFLTICELLPGS